MGQFYDNEFVNVTNGMFTIIQKYRRKFNQKRSNQFKRRVG